MKQPPRDSAQLSQGTMAARQLTELEETVMDLLQRIQEELVYNAAKGTGPYRQGMHDGLRFSEDALAAILKEYSGKSSISKNPADVSQMDA